MRRLHVKPEIRLLGLDDGPFKRSDKEVLVVGVVLRGREYLDGVLSTKVRVDGADSTDKIVKMVKRSRHFDQLRGVLTNGIAFGGFNIFDIQKIAARTGKFVIAVVKKRPDLEKFRAAMARLPNYKRRLAASLKAGEVHEIELHGKKMFYQCAGVSAEDAANVLRRASVRSAVPEAIRLAHIIASGIVEGESRGRP